MLQHKALDQVPTYQASKWLKLPLLLTESEMTDLLSFLPNPFIPLSGVIPNGEEFLTHAEFLPIYKTYSDQIQRGVKKPEIDRRLTFVITETFDDVCAVDVSSGVLIRILKPVIQVQPYTLHYSSTIQAFHEMTFSKDSFNWGLLFSYPQIFQNPQTQEVQKVTENAFPNTTLFKNIQRWSRKNTIPTSFEIEGRKINHHARIGKKWQR